MADASKMLYDNGCSEVYRDWWSYGVNVVSHTNSQYFGDLTAARIVEFGCGSGSFLKKCLAGGASFCLGFDLNDSMIVAGGNAVTDKQSETNGPLHFVIHDCFKPLEQNYGQFDFAACHFLLHDCSNEEDLNGFFRNVIGMLKPGGKMFVGQNPYVANTTKDQQIVADLCGHLQPLRSDSLGKDPFFVEVPAFHPQPTSVSKTGRPFTREKAFAFSDHYWSKEKLMANLKKVGFVNVALLPPMFSDDVASFEKEQIESLEEPFCLIGAEKPKQIADFVNGV